VVKYIPENIFSISGLKFFLQPTNIIITSLNLQNIDSLEIENNKTTEEVFQ